MRAFFGHRAISGRYIVSVDSNLRPEGEVNEMYLLPRSPELLVLLAATKHRDPEFRNLGVVNRLDSFLEREIDD